MSLFGGQQPPMAAPARPETNGLGVAGFVCSMIGLFFTGGLLSPIGLILSLAALGREPRGFATAGVVVGLIGSCGLIAVIVVGIGVVLAAILAAVGIVVAVALSEPQKAEITSDMITMAIAVNAYEEGNDYLPADLGVLGLDETTLIDPWGNRYEYHLVEEDPGFDVVSAGADGTFGTLDDVHLTRLGEAWETAGVDVTYDDDGGVRINVGSKTLGGNGDDAKRRVEIDLGDRVIEIVGDETGGGVEVEPQVPAGGGSGG